MMLLRSFSAAMIRTNEQINGVDENQCRSAGDKKIFLSPFLVEPKILDFIRIRE